MALYRLSKDFRIIDPNTKNRIRYYRIFLNNRNMNCLSQIYFPICLQITHKRDKNIPDILG